MDNQIKIEEMNIPIHSSNLRPRDSHRHQRDEERHSVGDSPPSKSRGGMYLLPDPDKP